MQTINIALFIYSSILLVAIYMYSRQTKYSLLSDKYFKVINDTFGHVLGDEAIKKTVSLLYDVCQKNEFLSRYGGDEFLIITTKHESYDIEQLLNKIDQVFESFNRGNKKYQLNISYGYYTYESSMSLTDAEFLDIVDQNMFKNKKEKSNLEL